MAMNFKPFRTTLPYGPCSLGFLEKNQTFALSDLVWMSGCHLQLSSFGCQDVNFACESLGQLDPDCFSSIYIQASQVSLCQMSIIVAWSTLQKETSLMSGRWLFGLHQTWSTFSYLQWQLMTSSLAYSWGTGLSWGFHMAWGSSVHKHDSYRLETRFALFPYLERLCYSEIVYHLGLLDKCRIFAISDLCWLCWYLDFQLSHLQHASLSSTDWYLRHYLWQFWRQFFCCCYSW